MATTLPTSIPAPRVATQGTTVRVNVTPSGHPKTGNTGPGTK